MTLQMQWLLINAFGGAGMGKHVSHSYPRCTPLVTANTFVVDELSNADFEKRYHRLITLMQNDYCVHCVRYIARVILIPFIFDASEVQIGQLEHNYFDECTSCFSTLA